MRYLNPVFLLGIFISLQSCEVLEQLRTTDCTNTGVYDYLNHYEPGTLCNADTCVVYQSVWKDLFLEKNNLTESYFTNHIELCNSTVGNWDDGVSFNICYKIRLGWAIAYMCDQFIIKIDKDNQLYPALDVPRGTYLTKDQIRSVINFKAFSSQITKLSGTEILKYNTMDSALKELIHKAKVNTLCLRNITINSSNGNLTLVAGAQYNNEVNSCIYATIDLITGETAISDGPCYIN